MSGRVKQLKMVPLDKNPRVKLYAGKARQAVANEKHAAEIIDKAFLNPRPPKREHMGVFHAHA